jgi:hypothetical protein
MTTSYPDRLSEIKARLQAATSEPWTYEPSADGREVYGLQIGRGCGALDEDTAPADIHLMADAANDLRWAVEEIDYLRLYIRVLGDLAYALDALRWALEAPAPGRIERRRRAFEEARRELLAMPNWRPGECHGGCRRYATHAFVIDEDGHIDREPCCEECGTEWLAIKQRAIDARWAPVATVRLEPIAQRSHEAGEVWQ